MKMDDREKSSANFSESQSLLQGECRLIIVITIERLPDAPNSKLSTSSMSALGLV